MDTSGGQIMIAKSCWNHVERVWCPVKSKKRLFSMSCLNFQLKFAYWNILFATLGFNIPYIYNKIPPFLTITIIKFQYFFLKFCVMRWLLTLIRLLKISFFLMSVLLSDFPLFLMKSFFYYFKKSFVCFEVLKFFNFYNFKLLFIFIYFNYYCLPAIH